MEDLVLNAIDEAETAPSVSQIGRSLGHPRQVIQRTVNSLVDTGCVRKLENPTHRKVPLLSLTSQGKRMKQKSNDRSLAIADAFLQRIDARRCEKLAKELHSIRQELEAFIREKDAAN